MKEIERILTNENKQSYDGVHDQSNSTERERLLYPELSLVSERLINEKIEANNKFKNNINIIKDILNYYETETNNYKKKLSRYKNYINVAEITEKVLSSIATTATTISVALTGK